MDTEERASISVEEFFRTDSRLAESQLAKELFTLGPRLYGRIGVPAILIVLIEFFFRAGRVYSQPTGTQSYEDLLKDEIEMHPWFQREIDEAFEPDSVERTVRRLVTPTGKRFLERAMGSAVRHRITRAIKTDLTEIRPAIDRLVTTVLPIAYALDTCLRTTPEPDQEHSTNPFLTLLVTGSEYLNSALTGEAVMPEASLPILVSAEADRLSQELPSHAFQSIEKLETPLKRKIEGARQVLRTSVDGPSQAANSAVEFIDWLARSTLDDLTVLDWLKAHLPERSDLLFQEQGLTFPTKKAYLLCLLHAGMPPRESFELLEQLATALIRTRRILEGIKHSGLAEPDLAATEAALEVVEAFVVVLIRVAWVGHDAAVVEEFVRRLKGSDAVDLKVNEPQPQFGHTSDNSPSSK